ncbi:hypothetical protein [Gilvimarinus algae]|uniref:DUF883 domain-containing protein n=1 Tax=Gilvimarinus algae TaxID=3058037 RepID=A0ABT8TJ35_9GAMM|nr:hypothetical protein [Gilvimarinus sp. SDUM040014]MDO3383499.1 hypothetical protein [Gilvimarinus sp. SDUM040014]
MASQTASKTNSGKAQEASVSDALDQIKDASASVYEAVGSIGSAGAANARLKVEQGREQAREYSAKAENVLRERPLVTVGVAFAAGWLVSRLISGSRKAD